MICGKKITKNIGYHCALIGGVEARLWLFNRDEVLGPVRDVTNPQIITDLTMKVKTTGTPNVLYSGYRYEGYNNSVKPKETYVAGKAVGPRFDHVIDFVIFSRNSDVKAEIEAIAAGKFIAIIENVNKADDNAFEVYGLDVGLELKSLTADSTGDTEGAYALQLGSPDNFKEPHLSANFFDTDYATTLDALNTLVSADVAI